VLRDYVEERKRDGAEPHVTAPLDFRSRWRTLIDVPSIWRSD